MPSSNVIHLPQPAAEPPPGAAGPKKKLRALLVEDSMADARLLRELVRDADPALQPELTHVQTLAHATGAVAGGNYDCVLLDLNLPDGSGVETVEAIRAASREIAIIVLSGLNEEGLALQALRRGAQEYALKGQYDGDALLRIMHHAVERNRVFADVDRQREREYFLATHDPLTGLPNRQMLLDHARLAITQAERHKGGLALCFVDLDNFKPVNDTHGHAIGDALLCEVGSILSQSVRDGDTVARTGGDEFVVLLTSVGAAGEAHAISQRMAERIGAIHEIKGCPIDIGASIGLAIYPEMGKTFEELMANADAAMYEVKRGRGGGVAPYRGGNGGAPAARGAEATHDAILYFQPWWDSARKAYGGIEVLPRLPALAGTAFQFAESSAAPLSGATLTRACLQWEQWRAEQLAPGVLAIDAAHVDLCAPDFGIGTLEIVTAAGLAPSDVQLEVEEGEFDGGGDPALLGNLRLLRGRGVRVVVDHYGRDAAALATLARLPVDGVKLDGALFQQMRAGDPAAASLVRGLLAAARAMALEVIVCGVDGGDDVQQCAALNCTQMQGEWLTPPVNAAALSALLHEPRRIT